MDVVAVWLELSQRFIDVGARSLYDECSVSSKNVVEILLRPDAGGGHGLDKVGAGEEGDVYRLAGAIATVYAVASCIYLLFEVVKDFGSGLVFLLLGLPGVDHQPVGGFVDGELAHCYPATSSIGNNSGVIAK